MAIDLSCTLCSSPFSEPRLLPCLHVFCKSCLDPLYSQNEEGTLACPICYKINTCPSPAQLPRHLRIEREVKQSRIKRSLSNEVVCESCDNKKLAEAYCVDCNSPICSDCTNAHSVLKITRRHNIISSLESTIAVDTLKCAVPCIDHPDESIRYYCRDCNHLQCDSCLFTHKGHDWYHVSDSESESLKGEKDELEKILLEVQNVYPEITKALKSIDESIQQTELNAAQAIKTTNDAFQNMMDILERRRIELIQQVKDLALDKTAKLDAQKAWLGKLAAGFRLGTETGNVAVNDCTSIEALEVKKSIVNASSKLLQEAQSTSFSPVCSSNLKVCCLNCSILGDVAKSIGTVFPCFYLDFNPDLHVPIGVEVGYDCSIKLRACDMLTSDMVISSTIYYDSMTEYHRCSVKRISDTHHEICFNIKEEGKFILVLNVDKVEIFNLVIHSKISHAVKEFYREHFLELQPAFVDVSADNLVYVTFDEGFVNVYDSLGKDTLLSYQIKGGENLRGIAVGNDTMFIASAGKNQIIKASVEGEVIARVGSKGSGELEFDWPMGLCLTRDNLLLVADSRNNRIQVLESDSLSFIRSIPCLSHVNGVTVDGTGNIHAAAGDRVEVFHIAGEKITEYGQGVLEDARDVVFPKYLSSCTYCYVSDNSSEIHMFDWMNDSHVPLGIDSHDDTSLGIALVQEGFLVVCCYINNQLLWL